MTVTAHSALSSPSSRALFLLASTNAVIVALPSATPVTTPASTVALASSEDFQTTVPTAPAGASVAFNVTVEPTLTSAVFLSNLISVGSVAAGGTTERICGFFGSLLDVVSSYVFLKILPKPLATTSQPVNEFSAA